MDTDPEQHDPMPCAPEAESAVICCVIENPQRFTGKAWEDQVSAEFFYSAPKAQLWRLMFSRIQAGKSIDPVSLREAINDEGNPILTINTLHHVLTSEFNANAWTGYVETLRDRHARRIAIQAGRDVLESNADGSSAADILRAAAAAAAGAMQGTSVVLDAKKAVQAFIDAVTDRYNNGERPGLETGVTQMDDLTGGMRKGELWVIGAKTSGGKSILMLQIAAHALTAGKRVAIFTLEMGADEVIGRMISCAHRISIGEILNPRTSSKSTLASITEAATSFSASGLMVCDAADMTIESISGHCQRIADAGGLDLVVIDYLQMVSSPKIKGQNREQEVANISRACKQLAKRLKCPVLTATQLNEDGKARESRAIENDADAVFLILNGKSSDGETTTRIQAWKCRNAERGAEFGVRMDGEHQKFIFF